MKTENFIWENNSWGGSKTNYKSSLGKSSLWIKISVIGIIILVLGYIILASYLTKI